MPSHMLHRAFCEVLFEKLGIDKKYLDWSVFPDLDVIGLHRYKYHSLLNIDKLYRKILMSNVKVPVKDKNAITYGILSHVYLDQFTCPVFWQGLYFPALVTDYSRSFIKDLIKKVELIQVIDWIKFQIKVFEIDLSKVMEILSLYDQYLTKKFFGNLSNNEVKQYLDQFKSEVYSLIPESNTLNFMLSSLVSHTPFRQRLDKVLRRLSAFRGKKIKFKYYYNPKIDEKIKMLLYLNKNEGNI